jgi:hypothetical protein
VVHFSASEASYGALKKSLLLFKNKSLFLLRGYLKKKSYLLFSKQDFFILYRKKRGLLFCQFLFHFNDFVRFDKVTDFNVVEIINH